jgi:hypothetical protein
VRTKPPTASERLREALQALADEVGFGHDLAEALGRVPEDVLRRELAALAPHLARVARVHGR